jgi:hypothetical protein
MAKMVLGFKSFENIINGRGRTGETSAHGINPSTGVPWWDGPVATEERSGRSSKCGYSDF